MTSNLKPNSNANFIPNPEQFEKSISFKDVNSKPKKKKDIIERLRESEKSSQEHWKVNANTEDRNENDEYTSFIEEFIQEMM